jgi:hypothetical protein
MNNICAYNIFNLFSWSMIKKNICAYNILIYFHEVWYKNIYAYNILFYLHNDGYDISRLIAYNESLSCQ